MLVAGLMYFFIKPMIYTLLFWGPVFAFKKLGTQMEASAWLTSVFELSALAGMLISGYASDKFFQARRMPVCGINLVCLFLLFATSSFFFTESKLLFASWFLLAGVFLHGPEMLLHNTAIDFAKSDKVATSAGFVNGCGAIGMLLGLWLPGYLSIETLFSIYTIISFVSTSLAIAMWNQKAK